MTTHTDAIYDASNRYLAPPQTVLAERPFGPWIQNQAPPPRAVFAFVWDLGGGVPPESFFHILGGPSDQSTVSESTLRTMGIAVPEAVA